MKALTPPQLAALFVIHLAGNEGLVLPPPKGPHEIKFHPFFPSLPDLTITRADVKALEKLGLASPEGSILDMSGRERFIVYKLTSKGRLRLLDPASLFVSEVMGS